MRQLRRREPAEIATHGGGRRLRELLCHGTEAGALADLLEQAVGERLDVRLLARIVDCEVNLGDPVLGLPNLLLDPRERVLDLLVGDTCALDELALHQLVPDCRGLDLVRQRRARDAVLGEHLLKVALRHVVLLLQTIEGLVGVVLAHRDVELLGLLHLEFLVDQRAQDLRSDPLAHLLVVGELRRQQHEADASLEIAEGDHVLVDDGGDPRLLGGSGPDADNDRNESCSNPCHRSPTMKDFRFPRPA